MRKRLITHAAEGTNRTPPAIAHPRQCHSNALCTRRNTWNPEGGRETGREESSVREDNLGLLKRFFPNPFLCWVQFLGEDIEGSFVISLENIIELSL